MPTSAMAHTSTPSVPRKVSTMRVSSTPAPHLLRAWKTVTTHPAPMESASAAAMTVLRWNQPRPSAPGRESPIHRAVRTPAPTTNTWQIPQVSHIGPGYSPPWAATSSQIHSSSATAITRRPLPVHRGRVFTLQAVTPRVTRSSSATRSRPVMRVWSRYSPMRLAWRRRSFSSTSFFMFSW